MLSSSKSDTRQQRGIDGNNERREKKVFGFSRLFFFEEKSHYYDARDEKSVIWRKKIKLSNHVVLDIFRNFIICEKFGIDSLFLCIVAIQSNENWKFKFDFFVFSYA